ncbi:helix-turn-helix transcriptional regulator [Pseudobacteroides cellulosolvens]|uniref:Transcriptional regulator with only HTH domain, AraC family n=1 Tax=Pseudobacteroides cellulosolvens ATCC 35603 = DSM 2933 TaxID=398512 RepID=A0A0L6JVA6_9FIRM|nr:AraC family transcriptional regulator [Pseudobacteroides cellulosolvens]KNY29781.1 transcriptional regulator with only HTH domain, AraC family [Pseudobacteroides cellulosolvens ATCC 35603 = DSM 2933]
MSDHLIGTSYSNSGINLNYPNKTSANGHVVEIKLPESLASKLNNHNTNDKIKEIGLCIKNGVEKNSTEIIDNLFDDLYTCNNLNFEKAKVLYINITTTIIDTVTEFGFSFIDISDTKILPYNNSVKFNNLIEMKEFLKKLTLCAAKFIKDSHSKKRNKTICDIVQYINLNATDPSISLTKVAGKFYMNPSYLSRIFRQVTGYTFVEYITRTRINIALKLFKETDLKGYEIGEKVGIHDPNYFGKCFKKCTGMSLNSYRKLNQ